MHQSNMSSRKKSKLALIFLSCGSLAILTAFSTTGWLKLSNDGTKIHIGLWRVCSTKCVDLNGVVLGMYKGFRCGIIHKLFDLLHFHQDLLCRIAFLPNVKGLSCGYTSLIFNFC